MIRLEFPNPVIAILAVVSLGAPIGAQNPRPRPPERPLLIAHEILRAGAVNRGVTTTLTTMMRDDAALLWPGLPVVTTKPRITAALDAQGYPLGMKLHLQPLHHTLSADSTMIVFYGSAYWATPDNDRGEMGQYLMAWHRRPDGWSLGAFALSEVMVGQIQTWPAGLDPIGSTPMQVVGDGDPRPFIVEDLAFADSARSGTVSAAFRHWIAPNGVTFGSTGVLNRGPDETAAALQGMDSSSWSWRPVAAGASDDGSLGWTAGQAEIVMPDARSGSRTVYSSYLTLWQRQPDGSIRFLADGGSPHPRLDLLSNPIGSMSDSMATDSSVVAGVDSTETVSPGTTDRPL